MKKIFLAVSIAISISSFTSCSNEETLSTGTENKTELTQNDATEIAKLQSQITDYNNAHFSAQPQTRGLFKWLFKGLCTAFADAVGGAIGGIAGGTVTSGVVGLYLFSDKNSNINVTWAEFKAPVRDPHTAFSNIVVNNDSVNNYIDAINNDSIGYYHNAVLYDIFNDSTKLAEACKMTSYEFGSYVLDRVNRFYPIDKEQIIAKGCINDGITIANIIRDSFNNSDTKENIVKKLGSKLPLSKEVIELLITYIEGAVQSAEEHDNNYYLKDMLKIIESANLTPEVKESIKNGFIIGNASSRMWEANDTTVTGFED